MGKMKLNEMSGDYEVIVVGGGLGGLTAANVLGRNGRRVLLIEQHSQLGGLATYFRRKQHVFDVALHGFPIGMKKTLRKYWSQELADRIIQVKSIRFDNPQFTLETTFTREDFTRILIRDFKIEPETVNAFYEELERMNFYDDQSVSNRKLFEKYFPGRSDVVRLLMEPITYANGSNLDEPAITYGIVFSNFMSKGVYTFLGGTDLMLEMMAEELTRNGVDFCLGAKCEKVIVKQGQVAGAMVNGREVPSRVVLSNGNILNTIREWTGEEHFSADFLDKVRVVRPNNSSCQVYLGLKPGESFDYIGDLLFTSTYPTFAPEQLLSREVSSRTYSVYYPEIRPGADDYTVVASMNSRYEDWVNLNPEEYRQAKQDLIDETLEALAKFIPGIAGKIDYAEAATPLTFRRYTLHGDGASFGTKFEGLAVSTELPKQIGGLFHAGSVGIIMSGWLGAANYGVIVANNVEKYLGA